MQLYIPLIRVQVAGYAQLHRYISLENVLKCTIMRVEKHFRVYMCSRAKRDMFGFWYVSYEVTERKIEWPLPAPTLR